MAEKTQIKAGEMVRHIRDEQATLLAGESDAEIIAFFRKAGEAARRKAKRKQTSRRRSNEAGSSKTRRRFSKKADTT
jgi:hypothetical protein